MWPFKKKQKRVKFGGKSFDVNPLNLEQTLELMLVLSPHLALIEHYIPQMRRLLNETSGQRPQLIRMLFVTMRDDMRKLPGDITRALAILCGVDDPVWLAKTATPEEFIKALNVLDEVHDFKRLWLGMKGLGISIGYNN